MVNNVFFKLLIVYLAFVLMPLSQAAEISIDRDTVRVNETFEMTINISSQPDQSPELSALPDGLEVLSNNNFYRRSIINGRTTQQSGWRFTIRAREEGIFTIPPIAIDGTKTQPLIIKVLPAVNSTEINGQAEAIRLTSELDQSEVYVQQQIVYTIRLYRSVQAQYASLSEPVLEGALIETLGDDIQYDTVINAVPYRVLERKYAIYPQESGSFEISGVVYTAEVSSGNRRFSTLGSLRGRNRSISLTTEPENITVKPIPTEYNDWWLPAKNLKIEQNWSVATDSLEIGSPVTWTYNIEAQGLTATQIPDIQPVEVTGLKFYPEQAVSNNDYTDSDIVASRTQKIAVIPTQAGTITIPEIRIPWWDVTKNEAQTLVIPAKELTVTGASSTANVQPQPASAVSTASDTGPDQLNEISESDDDQVQADYPQLLIWQIATGTLALLWIVTLLWRKPASSKTTRPTPVNEALKTAQTTHAELASVLKQMDAVASRKNMINYLQNNGLAVTSLADVIRLSDDKELIRELRILDRAIFGTVTENQWQPEVILHGIDSLSSAINKNAGSKKSAQGLPPLHPE